MVGGDKPGGRIGDSGVVPRSGAHDRGGLDGSIDRKDASRAVDGREGDVKPGGLGRRGRRGQIEKDFGTRPGEGSPGGYRGLDIVPVGGSVAGSHHEAGPAGVLARVIHEGSPVSRAVERRSARVTWQDTAIGRQ